MAGELSATAPAPADDVSDDRSEGRSVRDCPARSRVPRQRSKRMRQA